jgi:hypothetical protein
LLQSQLVGGRDLLRADVDAQRLAAQLLRDVDAGAAHPAANVQQLTHTAGEASH